MFCVLKKVRQLWRGHARVQGQVHDWNGPNGGCSHHHPIGLQRLQDQKGDTGDTDLLQAGLWIWRPEVHFLEHSPILANFIRSNVRTWKIWIVQASPWCVDPCSSGVDLQELKKFFCWWTKGGTSVNSFFQCGPPFDSRVEIFLSSWRSRPPEHGSAHHGEAWTI